MNIVTPEVTLLAQSDTGGLLSLMGTDSAMSIDSNSTMSEDLIEFAGRACYQSFDKPNPATRANRDYLLRTLFEQGHWSIAEHGWATLYFTGVSRAFTHELIRHRHLSYSQLSQRFVNSEDANLVLPPALRDKWNNDIDMAVELFKQVTGVAPENSEAEAEESKREVLGEVLGLNFQAYSGAVDRLMSAGHTRKEAREAARAFLPNMMETRIVVTGNLRAWHEVIARRTAPDADAEMREVMEMARKELADVSPVIFGKDNNNA